MPFTLAHPAAILPLRGLRYLRTAPLIIGAMIPDLPYYVPARFGHFGPETHSVTGSFTTCMVLGYATLGCVFLLRRPLTALLSPRARWESSADRKSTRLNSSHEWISYAVFCLKKKKTPTTAT